MQRGLQYSCQLPAREWLRTVARVLSDCRFNLSASAVLTLIRRSKAAFRAGFKGVQDLCESGGILGPIASTRVAHALAATGHERCCCRLSGAGHTSRQKRTIGRGSWWWLWPCCSCSLRRMRQRQRQRRRAHCRRSKLAGWLPFPIKSNIRIDRHPILVCAILGGCAFEGDPEPEPPEPRRLDDLNPCFSISG